MDNSGVFGVPRFLQFAAGPCFNTDGDDGGGESSSEAGGESTESGTPDADVASHLDPNKLVAEHGDAQRALGALSEKADTLEEENQQYRQRIKELEEQVPGGESVMITDEHLESLREKGFIESEEPSADDVLNALQEEREKRANLENRQTFQEVVQLTDADQGILEDIGADTLSYRIEDVDGGEGKRVLVETEDGDEPFRSYFQERYPNLSETFLPDTSGGDEGTEDEDEDTTEEGGGTYVPAQTSSDSSSTDDSGGTTDVNDFIENLNEERGRS